MLLFRARAFVIILSAATLFACGGSSSPAPSSPPPGSGDAIQITGRERFGWTQTADDITALHFAVYVDGARTDLPSAVCNGSPPSFDCNSPLPPLSAGRHVLEVVAWTSLNGEAVESPKASPLIVEMTGSTAPDAINSSISASIPEQASGKTAADSCGLAPIDPARFLFWTGGRDVRTVNRSSLAARTLAFPPLPENWKVIGVGAHSRFDDTGWIYMAQANSSGRELRILRYRDVAGVLGEAVVLRSIPLAAAPARAAVAIREDDRIYLALLAAAESGAREYQFLIRLNPDGSIPTTNPIGSIYMPVSGAPLALDWTSDDELPWFVERAGSGEYVLRRGGAAAASSRFRGTAPPVAMQFTNNKNASKRLIVVYADGTVNVLARTAAGWSIHSTRVSASRETTGDALLFPDGDLVTCGPDPDGRYVVRRVSVPE